MSCGKKITDAIELEWWWVCEVIGRGGGEICIRAIRNASIRELGWLFVMRDC